MIENLNKYTNYYFLTEGVSNMGGAQLLVLRRAKYLKSKGFNVKIIVLSHLGDFILEKEFKDYPILFLPELGQPLFKYSSREINKLLTTISLFFKNHKNTIIETNHLQSSVWGELVAKEFGYKHIVYLFNEAKIRNYLFYPGINFFLYKYKRGELYGCSRKSLEIILGDKYNKNYNNFLNVSFDSDEIKEETIPSIREINLLENSRTILTVSRLNKGYIVHLIEAVIAIAIKHPHKNINFIIGGGTVYEEVKANLEQNYLPPKVDLSNLLIIFTGYIKVMGKDLFNLADIFVGMGTASINAISRRCATIVINPETNRTPGVLGIHTTTFGYSDNGVEYSLDELLISLLSDDILLKDAQEKGHELYKSSYQTDSCFIKYDDLLSKSSKIVEYYNFDISLFRRIIDMATYSLKLIRRKYLEYK